MGAGEGNRGSEGTNAALQASRQAELGRGGGDRNCLYSIRGNENKGENSLWFGSPVGPAVPFPHVPRARRNVISTAWGALQMESSADLSRETPPLGNFSMMSPTLQNHACEVCT